MKIASIVIGTALVIITGIMIFLVKNGGALKPAGVIKPAEIGSDPGLIGRSIALRLFPEFQTSKNVIWYLESDDPLFAQIPQVTHLNYQNPQKPPVMDLQKDPQDVCTDTCWYIQKAGAPLPETLQKRIKIEPSLEIFVQSFNRNETVPDTCEKEKILDPQCVRPISVREVRRKIKTDAPHFFMQRYLNSEFFLFVESPL